MSIGKETKPIMLQKMMERKQPIVR